MSARGDISAGRAFVDLFLKDQGLVTGLASAGAKLRAWGKSMNQLGRSIAVAGTIAALPFLSSVKVAGDFAAEMSKVRAVTGATGSDFEMLREKAKELGATTSFSAREVAQGMTYLGMAGFRTQEILAGIPSVLNLAKAGALDLGVAADIASDISSAFGLSANEIGRVADVIAQTASSANTNVEMLGETMKYLAPLAAAAGQSLEDAATAAGVVANSGIKASMAGTDLASIMKKLAANKSGVLQGVKLTDDAGNMRSVIDIMEDLGKATANMTQSEQVRFFADNFERAAKSAMILSKGGDAMRQLQADIHGSAGRAQEMADIMSDNLPGAFKTFMSAVEAAQIAIGDALTPHLLTALDTFTRVTRGVAKFIEKNRGVAIALAAIVGTVVALGIGLITLGAVVSAVGTVFSATAAIIGTTFAIIGGGISFIMSPLGILTAAIVSFGVRWLAFSDSGIRAVDTLRQAFGNIVQVARDTIGGVFDAIAAGDIELAGRIAFTGFSVVVMESLGALSKLVGGMWGDTVAFIGGALLSGDIQGAWNSALSAFGAAFGQLANYLVQAIAKAAKTVVKVWGSAVGGLAKGMLKAASGDGIGARLMSKILGVDVRAEMERARKLNEQARRLGAAESGDPLEMMTADVDRQMEEMTGNASGAIDGLAFTISEFADGAEADLRDRVGGAAGEMTTELDEARKRLDALRSDAAKAAAERRKRITDAAAVGKEASDLADGMGGGSGAGDTFGTFSANALSFLSGGGGNVQQQMAKEIARGVEIDKDTLEVDKQILGRLRQMMGPEFG